MTEPTFVIAGGQRCGTTMLYHLLDEHPQVYMARPVGPEPKYFLEEPRPGRNRAWYLSRWFSHTGGARAVGDKSTSYMESPGVPRRIKEQFPDLKAVFLLRHPVERAISNYRFSRHNGLEHESFSDAIRHEDDRAPLPAAQAVSVSPFAYVRRGCYIDHLERFTSYFRRDEMLVLLTSELNDAPDQTCQRVWEFLGLDPTFRPADARRRLNLHVPDDLRISPEIVEHLLDRFLEPNRRLEAWLGRELFGWDRPTDAIRRMLQ